MKKKKISYLGIFYQVIFVALMFSISSCGDTNIIDVPKAIDPGEIVTEATLEYPSGGGLRQVLIKTTVKDLNSIQYSISENGKEWCNILSNNTRVEVQEKKISITVESNRGEARKAILTLTTPDGLRQDLTISQDKFSLPSGDYPSNIFTDITCSELKSGVTDEDIMNMPEAFYKDIAVGLKNGTYAKEFRIQTYRPYQEPEISKRRTRTLHTLGILDNVTGIFAETDNEEVSVLVGDTYGQTVRLISRDYDQSYSNFRTSNAIELKTGLNTFTPKRGLFYILIHINDEIPLNPESEADQASIDAKKVKIHFVSGQVNGYFNNSKHTAEDSQRLRDGMKFEFFDVQGKYAQLAWNSIDFKESNTNFSETMRYLDELARLELEHSGLIKYKKEFGTRLQFLRTRSGGGNPNATVYTTYFTRGYNKFFAAPTQETFLAHAWGLAHEAGHCNQLNPGFRWAGMGEVGNNMYSIYVKTKIGGFEASNMQNEDYYNKARIAIIESGVAHALAKTSGGSEAHFEKLVPFWQLQLYIAEAKGYTDFYKDLNEYFRTNDHTWTTFNDSGPLQLDFVRNVCRIAKTDFIDFFKAWGLLTPIDAVINDYGNRIIKITQQDIDALIVEIEGHNYPKPTKDVTTITDVNFSEFK